MFLIILGIILSIAGLWTFLFIITTTANYFAEKEGIIAAMYDAYAFTNLLTKCFVITIIALIGVVYFFGWIYNLFV